MSKLPLVAIIGRPNTGKSTLFNRLVRKRVAIESEIAGTTRDHITRVVDRPEMRYLLLDTGGMGGGTEDKDFESDVHAQSLIALRAADLIVFTINGREELTGSDHKIIELLRKQRRRHVPVILVITKCDTPEFRDAAMDVAHQLNIADEVLFVSAAHNIGTEELQEEIAKHLKKLKFEKAGEASPETADLPRIAIIGKPNVGKSSIINALMSDGQRDVSPKLVSDIPGTTRDATDTVIRYQDQEFIFVDTAGLRRQARVEEELEELSVLRTLQTLEDCDVALLVLDATEPLSKQDKHIAGLVIEYGKGLIILANKIESIKGDDRKMRIAEIAHSFPFCRFAPLLPTSATTRENLLKIFDLALMVHRNRLRHLETPDLHEFFKEAMQNQPMGALATAKHITQAKDPPPTFAIFLKNPKQVQLSQLRYLENRLRERFGLQGVPVRWVIKSTMREMEPKVTRKQRVDKKKQ
jgi:GTP-binding protein